MSVVGAVQYSAEQWRSTVEKVEKYSRLRATNESIPHGIKRTNEQAPAENASPINLISLNCNPTNNH